MIDFLAGALTMTYAMAAMYFVQFWRRSRERLFIPFAVAFGLLALNQLILAVLAASADRGNYAYILRVLAFTLIMGAILDKNLLGRRRRARRDV